MKKAVFSILGFVLFLMGFLSLILSLVGVQFTYMRWLDFNGRGLGFLLRIVMIIVGMIIIYFSFAKPYDYYEKEIES